MKGIFLICFFIFTAGLSAQNLQLKFNTGQPEKDSLYNIISSKTYFKDFNSINEFLKEFTEKLQYEGYFNSRIGEIVTVNDSVFELDIKLRQKYNVIAIKNISEYSSAYELNPHVRIEDLSFVFEELLDKFSKEGKPFSTILLEDIEFGKTDTIAANLVLNESKRRNLDQIILKGYDKFPKAFLRNYANIKIGKVFNRKKLIEQSEKLDALQFVTQSKAPQVQFTRDSTKLYVYLEKQQANSFDGFIGFNNSDENEFQLNGNIDLRLVNNFHGGEEINLNYKNDGNAQEWFDIGVRLPYLLKSKFTLGAGLGFFKQDSTFSNTSQHLKLDYQISSNINLGLLAAFENSSNLLDVENTRADIQDYSKNRYGMSLVYDRPKRFSRLFLSSQQMALNFGIGTRSTSALEETQQFIELNGRQIFKINKRQFIFLGLNAGYIDSEQYLSNELYRFGGINSIRGFIENRFFANLYGTLQTEYRYVLGSNLYVHSVLDYGFYENEIDRVNENLYSLGFGFGLETKAGVLRLIFANGGSDSQDIEFTNTQIHLKFVSIF